MKRDSRGSILSHRQRAQARSRRRTHHPLDIRSWVVGKDPDAIRDILAERVDTLENTLEPYREIMTRLADVFGKAAAELVTGRPAAPFSPDRLAHLRRLLASNQVRAYFRENPYRDKFLPRIADRGAPWEVLPDEIHIFDLPSEAIRTGLQNAGPIFDSLERVERMINLESTKEPEQPVAMTELLVNVLVDQIYAERALAWWNPFVQHAILELLKTAHYSPFLEERRQAAAWLREVFHAFMPDLSQHLERRDEQLLDRLQQYEDLYEKVAALHRDLKTLGRVTPGLLTRARQDVDPRIRAVELRAWSLDTASDITLALLAEGLKISSATLADQLTQARRARRIQDSWNAVRDTLPTTSDPPTAVHGQSPSSPDASS
jgi:hypothetical protein